MAGFLSNPCFRRVLDPKAERPWELHEDLRYDSEHLGQIIVVPDGYRTDFASIPWFFRRLFPQDGPWTLAAVVHDFLCDMRFPDTSSKDAAIVFHEAMLHLAVPKWKAKSMYKAVLWFGPKWEKVK